MCACPALWLQPGAPGAPWGRRDGRWDVHGGAGGKVLAVPFCSWQEDVTKNWQVHTFYC